MPIYDYRPFEVFRISGPARSARPEPGDAQAPSPPSGPCTGSIVPPQACLGEGDHRGAIVEGDGASVAHGVPVDGRGDCGAPFPAAGGVLRSASAYPSRRTARTAFFDDPPEEDDPLLGFAPYVHAAPRRNSITPDRQRAFIAALAATGIVTQAARTIGASLEALYKLRHRKGAEGFSKAWDMAIDRGVARLEDCALERAIQGEERVVVWDGKVVATWRRYDTALMLFLLRQRRAERYGGTVELRREQRREAREYDSEAILDRINAKIEKMKERRLAAEEPAPSGGEEARHDEE